MLTKEKYKLLFLFPTVLALGIALSMPAFAITESEVEAQISASGRESVTGNVLIWFLCAVSFLKVSQKIDSFLASLGVNVGHTGGSMMAETMIAVKSVTMLAGGAGKALGGLGRRAGGAGTSVPSGTSGTSGSSWAFKGGLAGIASRKISRDAVKTATTRTQTASSRVSHSSSSSHAATAAYSASAIQSERVTDRQTARTTTVSQASTIRQAGTQQHDSKTAAFSSAVARVSSIRQTSLGGTMFTRSLLSGGKFANEVIGKVASGDLRSTGSIKGDLATQALLSYTGITALGDQAGQTPYYKGVEIGGGRITGTELTEEHPKGIAFAMYHAGQFTKPDGQFQPVHTADGQLWYKQYAEAAVVKTPFRAPDGEVDYQKDIVKKLPNPPKRKDRI